MRIVGQLVKRLQKDFTNEAAQIAGWCAHYGVTIVINAFYNALWKQKKLEPSFTSGALLGVAGGLTGIIGWKIVYEVHPNPPAKNLKRFFGHLMLAHVVFGVFSALTYKLVSANEKLIPI
jgi:hypothetical protein